MSRGADDPGLLDALTRLAAHLIVALRNRLELASIELGEARGRLFATIVISVAVVLLLGGAVGLLSAWVAAALWSTLGAAVLAWLALAYALGGVALLWWLRHRLDTDPPFLADTLAELQRDAASLQARRER